jgi:hypothetical protein
MHGIGRRIINKVAPVSAGIGSSPTVVIVSGDAEPHLNRIDMIGSCRIARGKGKCFRLSAGRTSRRNRRYRCDSERPRDILRGKGVGVRARRIIPIQHDDVVLPDRGDTVSYGSYGITGHGDSVGIHASA